MSEVNGEIPKNFQKGEICMFSGFTAVVPGLGGILSPVCEGPRFVQQVQGQSAAPASPSSLGAVPAWLLCLGLLAPLIPTGTC